MREYARQLEILNWDGGTKRALSSFLAVRAREPLAVQRVGRADAVQCPRRPLRETLGPKPSTNEDAGAPISHAPRYRKRSGPDAIAINPPSGPMTVDRLVD